MRRTLRTSFGTLALAAGLVLVSGMTAAALSNITRVTIIPVEFTFTDCEGHTFNLAGTVTEVLHITEQTDGRLTFVIQDLMHLEGTDTATGRSYVVNQTVHRSETTDGEDQVELTNVGMIRLISQDGSPNLFVRTMQHQTYNASGELTTFQILDERGCR